VTVQAVGVMPDLATTSRPVTRCARARYTA